ncbi:sensor histidine kinase NtrY-like [Aquimixticola soesokkakensis]|nr:PAS domain-containing sensor histidine kinase [Aquimixticola soesokkakensis]
MGRRMRTEAMMRFARLRRQRRFQNILTIAVVGLGPILALATFLVLGPLDQGAATTPLRATLLADFIYVLIVASLVAQRVVRMVIARRNQSAGSRLHLRLTGVFALLALIPTVTVAVFAVATLNFGLEGWFSERVRNVVGTSMQAAEAYEAEHRDALVADTRGLSNFISDARRQLTLLPDGELRQVLNQGQGLIQRGLREAYVIDSKGEIRARGTRSYLFDYEQPSEADITRAGAGEVVVIRDWDVNEFRALMKISGFADRYLYVTRDVDGAILSLLDDTQQTVKLYTQLENERGRLLFEFGLIYLGFALILILAATWLGLWFAERLARPVGRLTGAAQRVGGGDLDVQVIEEEGNDEIAMLGRIFNQMTRQLKGQRETLLERNDQIDARRRLFDSVLGSVTSGVIGLDVAGQVTLANRSALKLVDIDETRAQGEPLSVAVPEFAPLFDALRASGRETAQDEVRLTRSGHQEILLVRMALRRGESGDPEGYVVAFDDVTSLVSAQRSAAWGDVARRIAHEIKNPLTPIQLSAERIKRRFRRELGEEEAIALEQLTDVIVRQTGDLRRIVDEFSKFARMPEPERRDHDLAELARGAVLLQQNAQPDVKIEFSSDAARYPMSVDATMMGQALTNLIKNAGEAIETLYEKGAPDGHEKRIRVRLERCEFTEEGDSLRKPGVLLVIEDNGIGLPQDRSRLFEPYVTTRDKGTGLGLPIVKKIIEEHGGTLHLSDAQPLDRTAQIGARAEIRLSLEQAEMRVQKQELAV